MSIEQRIESLVTDNEVVLFMKGDRRQPQCGFSATVVGILDEFLAEYTTVDVLADADIREGVKAYSNWPTIPQLYVQGTFVGGCDIVREMDAAGELGDTLGKQAKPTITPEVVLTDAAMNALLGYHDGQGKLMFRLKASAHFQYEMDFDVPCPGDVRIEAFGCTLLIDKASARRVDGVTIDFVENVGGGGFKIDNPNEPPKVKSMTPADLKRRMDDGAPMQIFDVRTSEECATAKFEEAMPLDEAGKALLDKLDKQTALVLLCHHGMRSQAAAEHCLRMGFSDVYNLVGGIDAWSTDIDPSVPRY